MEKNGQLTFSDDFAVSASNEALTLLEAGEFDHALERIEPLITQNPDYPGLADIFRTARFWITRKEELFRRGEGKDRANFLMINGTATAAMPGKKAQQSHQHSRQPKNLFSLPHVKSTKRLFIRTKTPQKSLKTC